MRVDMKKRRTELVAAQRERFMVIARHETRDARAVLLTIAVVAILVYLFCPSSVEQKGAVIIATVSVGIAQGARLVFLHIAERRIGRAKPKE